jgi:CAAX protease family protein
MTQSRGWPAVPPDGHVYPAFPHPEPTPYHLMLRTWTYAWWKPVVGVVVAVVGFFIGAPLVFFVVAALSALAQPGSFGEHFRANADPTNVTPLSLLATNLALASLILTTWLLIRVIHRMRPRWLASVVPRLRWRFLLLCLPIALLALGAQIAVGSLVPAGGGDELGALNHFSTGTALSAVVVLLTTPLQAAGEEYLFRGYLLMAFGSLFGNKWVAILATATLFAIAHGTQNFPLFFDRLAFGLIAAWLVTRTGGIEAGIALHVLNNFLAFGLALAFGDLTSTLNVTTVGWWNIVLTLTQSVVYTGLVLLLARRMGLATRTTPPGYGPQPSRGPAAATA